MYRKPCIDVAQFCNDLCFGQNVATFVAFCCSPIHAKPASFAVYINSNRINYFPSLFQLNSIISKLINIYHMDHLMDALKLNNIDEKLHVIRLSLILSDCSTTTKRANLLKKNCLKYVKLKCVLKYVLDNMCCESPLNIGI